VRFGFGLADLVDAADDRGQAGIEPDQTSNLAERPLQATFGARAVVSDDVEDQGVVQLSGLIEAVDHAADLVVGKGEVAGVVFHQPGVHTFRVGPADRPRREFPSAAE